MSALGPKADMTNVKAAPEYFSGPPCSRQLPVGSARLIPSFESWSLMNWNRS
jgi:hypothetical protein